MNAKSKEHPTAIVTGASSGIGLGITQALLEGGYGVVANSRKIRTRSAEGLNLECVCCGQSADGDVGHGKREKVSKSKPNERKARYE
jgi:NAD(P)-dependent dehydrogenase (short-subunit alcohol dehydrogenase family)